MSEQNLAALDLSVFPMGPALRSHLGLGSAQPQEIPAALDWQGFERHLNQVLPKLELSDLDDSATILEELVLMKLPDAALSYAESLANESLKTHFRCCLAVGTSALIAGEFRIAEDFFRSAQELEPQEIAPYTNLCEVLYREERDDDCLSWAIAGLEADPNAVKLWELIGAVNAHRGNPKIGDELRSMAKEKDSWAGLSLAAQYLDPNDPMLRAELLEELYAQGLRDELFLVEYTAALGMALQYEKIPAVVWEAEKLHHSKQGLTWQLYAHAAQAYLASEDFPMAKKSLERALAQEISSASARAELEQLHAEASSISATPTIH